MTSLPLLHAPVIAAPMAGGPTTPALVRAAEDAGTAGFLAAGNLTAEDFAARMAELTASSTTFGIGVFAPSRTRVNTEAFVEYRRRLEPIAQRMNIELADTPQFDDDDWDAKLDLLRERPVPAVSFTFGAPSASEIQQLKRAGSAIYLTVTNATEARAAEELGADALIAQGTAAGGHSGAWDLHATLHEQPTAALVAELHASTRLPLVAAGGVKNSADVRELLHAGATAVQVGTLLLRTPEAGTSATHRAALADENLTETVLTRAFTGRWARSVRTSFTDAYSRHAPAGYPEIHRLTLPLRRAASAAGATEYVHLWAGTGFRAAPQAPASEVLRDLCDAF